MAEQPEYQHSQEDFRRLDGFMLYTTLIPAAVAVIVVDLIGPATLPNILLSHLLALWAGFSAVWLFHLKYRNSLSPRLARSMGMITGLMIMALGMVLGPFIALAAKGEVREWPLMYLVLLAEYLNALPVAARLSSSMTPEAFTILLLTVCMIPFTLFHFVAATLGSAIAIWMFPQRPMK